MKEHKSCVDKLFSYRSKLIHYEKDSAKGEGMISIDILDEETIIDFRVGIPIKLARTIKDLSKYKIKGDDPTILDIALWISERSLEAVNNIITIAKKELEPKFREHLNKQLEKLKKEKPELFGEQNNCIRQ